MFMHKSKKGFTIVELVIVIAVIAILAAVLIPSFSSLNKKAKDSAYLQERTNQQIADLAEKVENQNFLSWEDLEAKLAEELAKLDTVNKDGVTDAIAAALAKFENSLKTDDTALTEAQVKAIVEKALEGQLTTAQVEGIVKAAVKEVFPGENADTGSDLTAAEVKSIVDAAVAGLNKQTGITKEEMEAAIAKALTDALPEQESTLTEQQIKDIVNGALAGFGYGNDPSIGDIQDIIDAAMGNAKLKADELAVKEMNEALAGKSPANIIDVVKILNDDGFNTDTGLKPLYQNYAFYWYKTTNQVVCVDVANGAFNLVFPEDVANFPADKYDENVQPLVTNASAGVTPPANVVTSQDVGATLAVKGQTVPESVKTFEDAMEWVNTFDDASGRATVKCTINGAEKQGIVLSEDVKLTQDVVIDVKANASTLNINIIGDVTIDLNGYSIIQKTSVGASLALFTVRDGATLNIIDSSEAKTGGIYVGLTAFQIDAGATVNMYGGKIGISDTRSTADIDTGAQLVFVYGGEFNMFGGTLTTEGDPQAWAECIGGQYPNGGAVYLYAGDVKGTVNTYYNEAEYYNFGATIDGDVYYAE